MQRWIDGGVALASRDDVTPLPGTEVFIGEASISTLWQFGIGFDSVINLANSGLDVVIDGSERSTACSRLCKQPRTPP